MAAITGDVVADGRASDQAQQRTRRHGLEFAVEPIDPRPRFDVALIGYRTDSQGTVDVGSRWGGTLGESRIRSRE